MTDLSDYEFKMLLGYRSNGKRVNSFKILHDSAPSAVDWRDKGAVTAIKN